MTTIDALTQLPSRLAGDEIHVAFTVVIDMGGNPTLWISDRNGKSHCVTAYRATEDDEERREAPWSFADLNVAQSYLDALCQMVRYRQACLADAHTLAREQLETTQLNRLMWEVKRETDKRAHDIAHPHRCSCDRRFKTLRGLQMHVARARWGTHAEAPA